MARREKKPPVTPERSSDWLRRSEEGESPPKIAASDGFDVRTVRKHLAQARQEKEVKEAKAQVMRTALERHYTDLCNYAAKLGRQTQGEASSWPPSDQYMMSALRQHLPRSPIWGYLNQRDKLGKDITDLKEAADRAIEESVKSNVRLKSDLAQTETGVIPGIVAALKFQLDNWAKGSTGLLLDSNYLIQEPSDEGFVNFRYGFSQMGKVAKSHVPLIREVLRDLEKALKELQEYKKMEEAFTELWRVDKNLRDEIAIITFRRIVPGHCRYCPL